MSLAATLRKLKSALGEDGKDLYTELSDLATQMETDLNTAQAEVADQTKSYTGLQRKLQQVSDKNTSLSETLEAAESRASTAENTLRGLQRDAEGYQAKLTAAEQRAATAEGVSTTQAKRTRMFELIMDKHPELAGLHGTLTPGDTDEATEAMLVGVSVKFNEKIEAAVAGRMQGYVPGGNFQQGGANGASGKGGETDPDKLYAAAMKAAGTPAFEGLMSGYYQALDAVGQLPASAPAENLMGAKHGM